MKADEIQDALLNHRAAKIRGGVVEVRGTTVAHAAYDPNYHTNFYRLTTEARQILNDDGLIPWGKL